eukprot:TRINITY_DN767_c3_g1_i1.p1 TRINITY_DN767_c3_g1~~TRINITY_DN767_c3_g1_i1.p1  ORF type:complete len:1280 (+),score=402.84 TRINITY_DN767_c3_g1_i1:73-3912(+)
MQLDFRSILLCIVFFIGTSYQLEIGTQEGLNNVVKANLPQPMSAWDPQLTFANAFVNSSTFFVSLKPGETYQASVSVQENNNKAQCTPKVDSQNPKEFVVSYQCKKVGQANIIVKIVRHGVASSEFTFGFIRTYSTGLFISSDESRHADIAKGGVVADQYKKGSKYPFLLDARHNAKSFVLNTDPSLVGHTEPVGYSIDISPNVVSVHSSGTLPKVEEISSTPLTLQLNFNCKSDGEATVTLTFDVTPYLTTVIEFKKYCLSMEGLMIGTRSGYEDVVVDGQPTSEYAKESQAPLTLDYQTPSITMFIRNMRQVTNVYLDSLTSSNTDVCTVKASGDLMKGVKVTVGPDVPEKRLHLDFHCSSDGMTDISLTLLTPPALPISLYFSKAYGSMPGFNVTMDAPPKLPTPSPTGMFRSWGILADSASSSSSSSSSSSGSSSGSGSEEVTIVTDGHTSPKYSIKASMPQVNLPAGTEMSRFKFTTNQDIRLFHWSVTFTPNSACVPTVEGTLSGDAPMVFAGEENILDIYYWCEVDGYADIVINIPMESFAPVAFKYRRTIKTASSLFVQHGRVRGDVVADGVAAKDWNQDSSIWHLSPNKEESILFHVSYDNSHLSLPVEIPHIVTNDTDNWCNPYISSSIMLTPVLTTRPAPFMFHYNCTSGSDYVLFKVVMPLVDKSLDGIKWQWLKDTQCYIPDAPTISAVDGGDKSATVTIQSGSDGGKSITSLIVKYDKKTIVKQVQDFEEGSTVTINIPNLINGVSYVFKAAAVNEVGQSLWSDNSTPVIPVAPSKTTQHVLIALVIVVVLVAAFFKLKSMFSDYKAKKAKKAEAKKKKESQKQPLLPMKSKDDESGTSKGTMPVSSPSRKSSNVDAPIVPPKTNTPTAASQPPIPPRIAQPPRPSRNQSHLQALQNLQQNRPQQHQGNAGYVPPSQNHHSHQQYSPYPQQQQQQQHQQQRFTTPNMSQYPPNYMGQEQPFEQQQQPINMSNGTPTPVGSNPLPTSVDSPNVSPQHVRKTVGGDNVTMTEVNNNVEESNVIGNEIIANENELQVEDENVIENVNGATVDEETSNMVDNGAQEQQQQQQDQDYHDQQELLLQQQQQQIQQLEANSSRLETMSIKSSVSTRSNVSMQFRRPMSMRGGASMRRMPGRPMHHSMLGSSAFYNQQQHQPMPPYGGGYMPQQQQYPGGPGSVIYEDQQSQASYYSGHPLQHQHVAPPPGSIASNSGRMPTYGMRESSLPLNFNPRRTMPSQGQGARPQSRTGAQQSLQNRLKALAAQRRGE